jgi:hypothetical protein
MLHLRDAFGHPLIMDALPDLRALDSESTTLFMPCYGELLLEVSSPWFSFFTWPCINWIATQVILGWCRFENDDVKA